MKPGEIRHFEILESGGLIGNLFYSHGANAYIVTIYHDGNQLDTKVFGNGVSAEDYLLDMLEFPDWTILKHA